jgi:hypothetical protein
MSLLGIKWSDSNQQNRVYSSQAQSSNRTTTLIISTPTLHETAAAVCLACLLVEHLASKAQVIGLVYKCVKLLSSPQHAVNGLVQHNLGLVCRQEIASTGQ